MQTVKGQSLALLRHELRTPVNHILGFAELLIDDASERHLEAFVPAFQQIQQGGRQLLECIDTSLADEAGPAEPNFRAFKDNLNGTATKIRETCTSVLQNFESERSRTIADLDAISGALRRLIEFCGRKNARTGRNPDRSVQRSDPASCEPISEAHRKKGGKILIADDDSGNRDLLRRCLELEGHQVAEAKNGLEVLTSLKKRGCDLILLDIMMPGLDGFETLAALKQEPTWRELPVIMISALDQLESVVRCIEMGADDYLPKPFNRVLLRARIGASLEKKWLRDRERRKTKELEQALRLLELAQEQLAVQASQDALTGLANRRSVDAHLDFRSKRGTPFSIVYIDLNGFKKINDSYGHQAGDDLLKQVGDRLRAAFRLNDIVGRWGGDEFVALLDQGSADAQTHTSRIAEVFSNEFAISCVGGEKRVRVGAAVGIADWLPGESVTEVLQRADAQMYQRKLSNSR